jgi:hypothetical protein
LQLQEKSRKAVTMITATDDITTATWLFFIPIPPGQVRVGAADTVRNRSGPPSAGSASSFSTQQYDTTFRRKNQ